MKHDNMELILHSLAQGGISVDEAARKLRLAPYQELFEGLNIDQQREQRTGLGETVLAEGKSPQRLLAAIKSLAQPQAMAPESSTPNNSSGAKTLSGRPVLATRVSQEQGEMLLDAFAGSKHTVDFWPEARLFSCNKRLKLSPPWKKDFAASSNESAERPAPHSSDPNREPSAGSSANAPSARASKPTSADQEQQSPPGRVVIITAGAADLPVALEALGTAQFYGLDPILAPDLGVAGLHRLQPWLEVLHQAELVIAVAGMDGALPSVLAGLCRCPVLGVPTSVGYGVAAGGYSALLNMLSGCAPGLAVLNVDNGYGAAMFAAKLFNSR